MPKRVELNSVPVVVGSGYPAPFDRPCAARARQRLGESSGLSDAALIRRDGEALLITDSGEEILRAGDSAGFKAGVKDGHHLQNRSPRDAVVLEIGSRREVDEGEYSDIDMRFSRAGAGSFAHKDGTPYPHE